MSDPVRKSPGQVLARTLGSRRLSTALMLSWLGLLLMWVIPFELYGLPSSQIRTIVYTEFFFRFLYVALAVATVACMLPRAASAVRNVTRAPGPSASVRISDDDVVLTGTWDRERSASAIRSAGFAKRVVGDEGWVWGSRHSLSALGTLVSHAAIVGLIAAAGYWMWAPESFEGSVLLAEGESFGGTIDEYIEHSDGEPPEVSFSLESVDPRFFEDMLLFTQLDCVLVDAAGRAHRVAVGSPWYPQPTVQTAIEDFGWTVELTTPRGDLPENEEQVFKLQVFPSGSPDYLEFKVDGTPYRMKVVVYGDYLERGGEHSSASFNLAEPRLLVTVWHLLTSKEMIPIVEETLVAPGDRVALTGDEWVEIAGVGHYGKFRIVEVFPFPLAVLGLLLGFTGFAARLVYPRTEVTLYEDTDGRPRIKVRSDVYGAHDRIASRVVAAWEAGERP